MNRTRASNEIQAMAEALGPAEKLVNLIINFPEIWQANNELAARLASYMMRETDWRDMKTVCAAFMLVQSKSGEPVCDDGDSREVLFHDDDYREVGEAMIKSYQRGSDRMMNPKLILPPRCRARSSSRRRRSR